MDFYGNTRKDKRNRKIIAMRDKGKSFIQIGKKFGMSYQRAWYIYKNFKSK